MVSAQRSVFSDQGSVFIVHHAWFIVQCRVFKVEEEAQEKIQQEEV